MSWCGAPGRVVGQPRQRRLQREVVSIVMFLGTRHEAGMAKRSR